MTKKITFKSFLFFIIIGLSITSLKQNSVAKKEDENLKLFFEKIVSASLELDKMNDSNKNLSSKTEEEKILKFNKDYTEYLLSKGKITEALEVMLTSTAILDSDIELMISRQCTVYPVHTQGPYEHENECFRSW